MRAIMAGIFALGVVSPAAAIDLDLDVGLGAGTEAVEGSPEAIEKGWNIRVCRERTEADEVKIEVGEPNAKNHETLATWNREAAGAGVQVYAVPEKLRDRGKIWVRGTPKPKKHEVVMAVYHKDEPKKVMSFDEREAANVGTNDSSDSFDCPTR